MVNLFVSENDVIEIVIYVGEDKKGRIFVDTEEDGVKQILGEDQVQTVEKFTFTFKKPSFEDAVNLVKDIFYSDGARINFNPLEARLMKISKLLKTWDLKDREGKNIPATEQSIKKLSPVIANAVGVILDSETGIAGMV